MSFTVQPISQNQYDALPPFPPAAVEHAPAAEPTAVNISDAHPAPQAAEAAPATETAAAAEGSSADYWDYLKTAGKITLTVIGIASAVVALVAAIGIFSSVVSIFTALPMIAQIGIVAGTVAAAVGAFLLSGKYFPSEAEAGPERNPEAETQAREERFQNLVREAVQGAIPEAVQQFLNARTPSQPAEAVSTTTPVVQEVVENEGHVISVVDVTAGGFSIDSIES